MKPIVNTPKIFHILVKPTGAACNLECQYCFYLSKEALYPGSRFRMSDGVLETYICQLLESHPGGAVQLSWQGGEPTLMGLSFFRRAAEYVNKYHRSGQEVHSSLQTNGIRINDEWAMFLKRHNYLVGLSMDGPQALHNAYRVDKGGKGTHHQVVRAWQTLKRHEVEVNILCTVHAANADHPLEVYRYFRDELGAQFIQFIPIVERTTPESMPLTEQGWGQKHSHAHLLYTQSGNQVTSRSVRPEQYGRFLASIFDEWVQRDVGRVFVQTFDAALASRLGQPSLCIHQPTCGNALALEHNGDLYACDHYVEPDYLLGNIQQTPLSQLIASQQQRAFGQAKWDSLPGYCRNCPVLWACFGECPRNRFTHTPDGEPGLNYLCAGYRMFINHILHPLEIMADLLRKGQYANEVMKVLGQK